MTLKGGEPYASWKVGPTAGKATDGEEIEEKLFLN